MMHSKLSLALMLLAFYQSAVAGSPCPLSVAVANGKDNSIDVTVSNTGKETITVYKGNTVLSGDDTQNTEITQESGAEIPFSGLFVAYARENMATELFETFQPGQKVIKTLNLAHTHNLSGISKANVEVVQSFSYIVGDAAVPKTLAGMLACEPVASNTVSIEPNQNLAKRDFQTYTLFSPRRPKLSSRAITINACNDARTKDWHTAVDATVTQANRAHNAAQDKKFNWMKWFKDADNTQRVLNVFQKIGNIKTGAQPTLTCNDFGNLCGGGSGIVAYAAGGADPKVAACELFWGMRAHGDNTCEQDSKVSVMVHEFSHLFGTTDAAYGMQASLALGPTKAGNNADNYRFYAEGARIGGCGIFDGN